MPTSDMFRVRGIGVAVIVSTSTRVRICLMRSLWATPKRCSSSTTSRPRSLNRHVLGQQPVGADDDVDLAERERLRASGRISAFVRKRLTISMVTGNPAKRSRSVLRVLEGQHRRRRQERDLLAVHHGLERRAHGHLGLAVADVAAQQPIHRRRRLHVALDVVDRRGLIARQFVGERRPRTPPASACRARTRDRAPPARCAYSFSSSWAMSRMAFLTRDLGLLPRGAAQPVERRTRATGVLLHEVEPLDGDEQLVVAVVPKFEELAARLRAADAELLEAHELADAVVHVHDQVADLEVAQVRQEGLGARSRRRSLGRRSSSKMSASA